MNWKHFRPTDTTDSTALLGEVARLTGVDRTELVGLSADKRLCAVTGLVDDQKAARIADLASDGALAAMVRAMPTKQKANLVRCATQAYAHCVRQVCD